MDKFVKPVEPKADVKPNEGYIYEGEKNYEPPKVDPWVEEKK